MFASTRPSVAALYGKTPAVLLLCVSCALCACGGGTGGGTGGRSVPSAHPEREVSQGAAMRHPPPVAEYRLDEPARFQAPGAARPQDAARPAPARDDPGYITLQPGETLSYISALYGVPEKDLMAWNGLQPGQEPRSGQRLAVRAPHKPAAPPTQATFTQVAAPAAASAPAKPAPGGIVVVAPGQSLSVIARQNGVTTAQLREWNDLTSDDIRAGRVLRVQPPPTARASGSLGAPAAQSRAAQAPQQETARAAAPKTTAAQAGAAQRPQQESARAAASKTPAKSAAPAASGMITVPAGSSLSGIAAKYKVSTADLRQWNKLKSDKLKTGQKLRVQAPVRVHTIKEGESLNGIAAKYKVSPKALMQKNALTNADKLPVGKGLIIP